MSAVLLSAPNGQVRSVVGRNIPDWEKATMTITIARTMTILCPDWCRQDEDHDPSINADGVLEADHPGPDFGKGVYSVGLQMGDVVTPTVSLRELERYDAKPAELRALAQSLLAAAAWLEAQS